MYIVGAPHCQHAADWPRDFYAVPHGQVGIISRLIRAATNYRGLANELRTEVMAIVATLGMMGIKFHIVYNGTENLDQELLKMFMLLGVRLADFTAYFQHTAMHYPRDFCTVLPGITLFDDEVVERLLKTHGNGQQMALSPLGQGGRVLFHDKTALFCGMIEHYQRGRVLLRPSDLTDLTSHGIKYRKLPSPRMAHVNHRGEVIKEYDNDHLDRWGTLLLGVDDKLHLVIDSQCAMTDHEGGVRRLLTPAEAFATVSDYCAVRQITVHQAPPLTIPYSLNMMQFPDGRVLMTSGDDDVEALIRQLVGDNQVVTTPIPIRFLPTICYAGIRCLVNDGPKGIINPGFE